MTRMCVLVALAAVVGLVACASGSSQDASADPTIEVVDSSQPIVSSRPSVLASFDAALPGAETTLGETPAGHRRIKVRAGSENRLFFNAAGTDIADSELEWRAKMAAAISRSNQPRIDWLRIKSGSGMLSSGKIVVSELPKAGSLDRGAAVDQLESNIRTLADASGEGWVRSARIGVIDLDRSSGAIALTASIDANLPDDLPRKRRDEFLANAMPGLESGLATNGGDDLIDGIAIAVYDDGDLLVVGMLASRAGFGLLGGDELPGSLSPTLEFPIQTGGPRAIGLASSGMPRVPPAGFRRGP